MITVRRSNAGLRAMFRFQTLPKLHNYLWWLPWVRQARWEALTAQASLHGTRGQDYTTKMPVPRRLQHFQYHKRMRTVPSIL